MLLRVCAPPIRVSLLRAHAPEHPAAVINTGCAALVPN